MRRITTFRSTTDRIYDGGPIIFFFFRWRCSPLWALTCRTITLHFCVTIRITNRCDFLYCVFISLFLVFSLHVSGFHGPIIRGISSCCFYATIWFMQCFVDRLRAVCTEVTTTNQAADARRRSTKHCMNQIVA